MNAPAPTPSARRRPRLVGALGLLVAAVLALLTGIQPGAARAASSCTDSIDGTITVHVCLTVASSLVGDAAVSAQVTVASGGPAVQKVVFSLDNEYVLTAYAPSGGSYRFTLPSARWVNGDRTLYARAVLRPLAGTTALFTSDAAAVPVTFANPGAPPVNNNSFTPTPGTNPPSGQPFVLAATGDGAGGEPSETQTTALIGSWQPNLLLYLGDVYDQGTATEFKNWYGSDDQWYSQFRSKTDPVVGNHEYGSSPSAAGYFDYWDNVPPYYSFDTHGWHVVALNSTTQFLGAAGNTTAQNDFLTADLDASHNPCTIVFYHHPLFNSGPEQAAAQMTTPWQIIAAHNVPLVLNGHDHDYQRWTPMDAAGNPIAGGTTEFVAGAGGHSTQTPAPAPNLVAGFGGLYGALRLELNAKGAAYRFVTSGTNGTDGATLDGGALPCSGQSDTTRPAAPKALATTLVSTFQVDLTWKAPIDDVGVTGYEIYRGGALVGTTTMGVTTFADTGAAPATHYSYSVKAADSVGTGTSSSSIGVDTPASGTLLYDGFESDGFTAGPWVQTGSASIVTSPVLTGDHAAHFGATAGTLTRTFSSPLPELYAVVHFYAGPSAPSPLGTILRLRSGTTALASWYVSSSGKLGFTDEQPGGSVVAASVLAAGWHALAVHVRTGGSSTVETTLDGAPQLSLTLPAGYTIPSSVGKLELGDASSTHTFDVTIDDVVADAHPIADTAPPSSPGRPTATAGAPTQVDLSWRASADDTGVVGYRIYRDGVALPPLPTSTSFSDTTAAAATTYYYQVTAIDAAGNESARSAQTTVSTPAGPPVPPDPPTALTATPTSSTAVALAWTPPDESDSITGYEVFRDGALVARLGVVSSFEDGGLVPASTHDYVVRSLDANGTASASSTHASATTAPAAPAPDTAAPSIPGGAHVAHLTPVGVDLAWSASSDDVGVTGYRVLRDGAPIAEPSAPTLGVHDGSVTPGGTYVYAIVAVDAAGNASPPAAVAVTVPVASRLTDVHRRAAYRVVRQRACIAGHCHAARVLSVVVTLSARLARSDGRPLVRASVTATTADGRVRIPLRADARGVVRLSRVIATRTTYRASPALRTLLRRRYARVMIGYAGAPGVAGTSTTISMHLP